jgi:hypothetical protein
MKKWIVTIVLAALSAVAWALPTAQEVQAEVQQGRYARAEEMMREVVAAKPDNAKAHYVYAEILARQGKVGLAGEEATKARQIDPDIKFTDPEKFRSFEAALLAAQTPSARAPIDSGRANAAAPTRAAPAAPTGVPSWVWLAGLVVVGVLLWRGFARSRAAQGGAVAAPGAAYGAPGSAYGPGAPAPMGTPPYGPGYQGYPPQRGSGLLGTGLAAAGGVAAGMLASEMLQRHRGADAEADGRPGLFDSPQGGPSADLENRPIDFGSGGDWDAGSSDVGGGSDGGGWD